MQLIGLARVCIAAARLDKPVPMVATADAGRVAAEVLQGIWNGRRVVELEWPRRVTPDEVAPPSLNFLAVR